MEKGHVRGLQGEQNVVGTGTPEESKNGFDIKISEEKMKHHEQHSFLFTAIKRQIKHK